jgi:cellulose synthase/poly-beta-1,6-N-acetylglucosamine synthase-like glycosyltransferase
LTSATVVPLVFFTAPLVLLFVVVARGLTASRREAAALLTVDRAPLTEPLTVVIPARNEAGRIAETLRALLVDESPHLRVLVYDDRSTDDTAARVSAIASGDGRVTLVVGRDRVEPGFGKPLALAAALTHVDAREPRVLFLDADVSLASGTVGGLVRLLQQTGAAALSGNPRLVCGSLVEEALVPAFVALVAALYRPSRVMRADDPIAFLNGQLLLVDRRALDDVGGFLAVKDTVLEDVALARLLKAKGHALALADLRAHAATRMYTSWSEIRSGFGKNAVALYGGPWRTFALGVLAFALGAAPLFSLAIALAFGPPVVGPVLVLSLAVMGMQAQLRRRMGHRAWPALVVPLTQASVAFVLVEAALRAWRGGAIHWRGRVYDAK